MIILGIDPGLDGALAWLDSDNGELHVADMPTLSVRRGKREVRSVDCVRLAALLTADGFLPQACAIEQVHSSPQMGVASAFAFGQGYGALLGVIGALRLPWVLVPPAEWKKHFRLIRAGKDASRAKATQFWPQHADTLRLKKHDGRAEAALIARYAIEHAHAAWIRAAAKG